jgi:hypothetical protein
MVVGLDTSTPVPKSPTPSPTAPQHLAIVQLHEHVVLALKTVGVRMCCQASALQEKEGEVSMYMTSAASQQAPLAPSTRHTTRCSAVRRGAEQCGIALHLKVFATDEAGVHVVGRQAYTAALFKVKVEILQMQWWWQWCQ